MTESASEQRFTFPRWANYLGPALAIMVVGGAAYAPVVIYTGLNPRVLNRGYEPEQPVAYSHALHVGELGMDCRYCHTTVDKQGFAAIPPTQTCMNCHTTIKWDSPKLLRVRESYATGMPIEWIKVHDLADYAYFNHSTHINRGIGCVSCHGRVDKMEKVYQVNTLSMAWCLDCHRAPEKHLRPLDRITDMDWMPSEGQEVMGMRLKQEYNIRGAQYMMNCSICHR